MASMDLKQIQLEALHETPGTLFACCDDGNSRLYGAGSDFAVYCVDTNAALAEVPEGKPAAKGDGKAPVPVLSATRLWTHHDSYVSSLLWNDGVVVSGGFDRRIVRTRADSGEKLGETMAHEGWVRDLALFPDRTRFVSAGDDMRVKLWDARTGGLIRTFEGHATSTPEGFATALYAVAVSPDGRHIAGADRIGDVCVWDVETGKLAVRFKAEAFYTYDPLKRARSIGGIRSVTFLPDGKRLALGGIGQVTNVDGFVGPCRIEVWDWTESKRLLAGQDKQQAILNHVEFHPASQTLCAAGGGDGGPILAFWNVAGEAPISKAKPKSHIQHFTFDATGTRLFAAGHGGFQVWCLPNSPESAG